MGRDPRRGRPGRHHPRRRPLGEAFTAFQDYVAELRERGIILAVCSKNNRADVLDAFADHPDMRLRAGDIAVLSAGWDDKPTQIRQIADTLGIGLDALVFVDDNPAERALVRRMLPEVDVLDLPIDPHDYVRALAAYPYFETAALMTADRDRAAQYQARARAAELRRDADDLDSFLRDLDMTATVVPLDEVTIPRVTQLINKTNQFNLTGRRRGEADVRAPAADPDVLTVCVRLADRLGDHRLVGVLVTRLNGPLAHIDTWLLSCRVIGRTLEDEMLGLLVDTARGRNARALRGYYHPSPKNALVADLYSRLGFTPHGDNRAGVSAWHLALDEAAPPPGLIRLAPDTVHPTGGKPRHQPHPELTGPGASDPRGCARENRQCMRKLTFVTDRGHADAEHCRDRGHGDDRDER